MHKYKYLILSGGKNRRMHGRNKLFMEVGGKIRLEAIRELIEATESASGMGLYGEKPEILLSTAPLKDIAEDDRRLYESSGLPVIEDIIGDKGPLGGIRSGLESRDCEALLVISSDFFSPDDDILTPLISNYRETGRPTFYRKDPGYAHPLPGIYTRDMLCKLREASERGELRLSGFVESFSKDHTVDILELSSGKTFYNLNTVYDVLRAEGLAEHKTSAVTLEEALSLAKETFPPLKGSEELSLYEATGRYIAEDYRAPNPQPPFRRSPLDGYAVRSSDLRGASKSSPVTLKVSEISYAGDKRQLEIKAGEAVRIMTGAPIPAGADTVIMQEMTDGAEGVRDETGVYRPGKVKIYCESDRGKNIVPEGEDYGKGELLVRKGEKLLAPQAALLASMGAGRVKLSPRVRISVFSTGDELVAPGEEAGYGKIYDSNLPGAVAIFKLCGEEIVRAERLRDEEDSIYKKMREALSDSDMVVTTGGVSVGKKDLMPRVLERLGAGTVFKGILMKPGMPTRCAECMGKPIFCLSGNPAAAFTHMELLIKPFLRHLHGIREDISWKKGRAMLVDSIEKKSPRRRVLRGYTEGGRVYFPGGRFSSGSLRGLEKSNCFIDIPEGSPALCPGSIVDVIYQDVENKGMTGEYTVKKPFIYAVSGYKNTGKTRLVNELLRRLKKAGIKAACIKHDGHDFIPDVPGTDSFSFREAGALGCGVFSGRRFMITREQAVDELFMAAAFPDAEIILIEGLKESDHPKYVCSYPEKEAEPDRVFEAMMRLYSEYRKEL